VSLLRPAPGPRHRPLLNTWVRERGAEESEKGTMKPRPPTLDVTKLPFRSRKKWRWRWLQGTKSTASTMHRLVTCTATETWNAVTATGTTGCGLVDTFAMPGIFSRMGARRCPRCCDAVGVAHGLGAPFNSGDSEPGCQGPAKEKSK
jgi:hypothetical protein